MVWWTVTRQTKKVRFARIAAKVNNRSMPSVRADGSIGTHPSVPCPPLPEHAVMDVVKEWLERHGCVVDRLNNGAGYLNGREDFGQYGIIGGGDFEPGQEKETGTQRRRGI